MTSTRPGSAVLAAAPGVGLPLLSVLGASICGAGIGSPSALAATPPVRDPPGDGDEASTVGQVVVTGLRPLLGDKIPLTLAETPQSVTRVSKTLMREQSDERLEDALQNAPGVTLNAGEGAARGDTINIRGFSAYNDFFLDGVRDAAVYVRDPFDLEEIEVIEGPSGALFGRGSTGGAVNQVSKAPTLDAGGAMSVEGGTNDAFRGTLDADTPIGPNAALRLNVMGETSAEAGRDLVHNDHWGVAPAVAFGLGQPTTLTLAYLHLSEHDRPDAGIPFVDGAPAPVPRGADFGLASDHADSIVNIGTIRLTHEVNASLRFADTLRYAQYTFSYLFEAPSFGAVADGGQGPPAAGAALSTILVGRDSPSSFGTLTNLDNQADLTARFATGRFAHTLVAGLELSRQTDLLNSVRNPFNSNNAWIPETPLLRPDPYQVRPAEPVSKTQNSVANDEAAYVTDTVRFGAHLDLIGSLRLDRFAVDETQATLATGAIAHYSHADIVPSRRLALVYKPAVGQSLYIAYGTSFDPSAESLSFTAADANLGPVKATTLEAGVKSEQLGGRLLLTGALFRTAVDNAQINDPENPTVTLLKGRERVRGIELSAEGRLTKRLEVVAGYTWLNGSTTGTQGTVVPVQTYTNAPIPNLAPQAGHVWLEYEIDERWETGFGVNAQGRRIANVLTSGAAPAYVPAYAVASAMLKVNIRPRATLQLNVINLFNTLYYSSVYYTSASENHALPGAGRTARLDLRVSF